MLKYYSIKRINKFTYCEQKVKEEK